MPGQAKGARQTPFARLKVYQVTAVSDLGPTDPRMNGKALEFLMRDALKMAKQGKLIFSSLIDTDEPERRYLAVIAPDDGESDLQETSNT